MSIKKTHVQSQVSWYIPAIQALRRRWQEDQEFINSLGYLKYGHSIFPSKCKILNNKFKFIDQVISVNLHNKEPDNRPDWAKHPYSETAGIK